MTNKSFSQISRNFTKKDQPLYELGAGVIAMNLPNYPGAKSTTLRVLPFPWIIYRGEVVRADEEGSRLQLIEGNNFELGFSGGFNFPIESNDNEARKDMPDTDALLGIGPAILYRVPLGTKLQRLTLGLGVRVNYSSTLHFSNIKEQGFIIEPYIRYWIKPNRESPTTYFFSLSYSYADQKYNRFFYQVNPEFATSERSAYKAKAGTVDIATSFGFSLEVSKKISIFSGGYYSNLSLSPNRDSPLVEEEHNIGYVFGISWMFFEKFL